MGTGLGGGGPADHHQDDRAVRTVSGTATATTTGGGQGDYCPGGLTGALQADYTVEMNCLGWDCLPG